MNCIMSSSLHPAPESMNMSRFKFVYWPPACECIGISIIYQAKTNNDDNNNKLSYHKWWQTIWRKMGMIMAYSRNIAIIYNKIRCCSSILNLKTGVTADADDGTGRDILSLSITYPADIFHIIFYIHLDFLGEHCQKLHCYESRESKKLVRWVTATWQ